MTALAAAIMGWLTAALIGTITLGLAITGVFYLTDRRSPREIRLGIAPVLLIVSIMTFAMFLMVLDLLV